MKRRDLERKLRIAGCYLKREGSSHSLWINPKNGIIEAVPRHPEIRKTLAGVGPSQPLDIINDRLKNRSHSRLRMAFYIPKSLV